MIRLRRAGGLLLGAALALATACATTPVPAPRPLPAGDPRPQALLDALVREAAGRVALRGVAKIGIEGGPAGSGRAKQLLAIERPARLRLEILGLLDQTLAVLVTDGARFRLARGRSVESGPVGDSLLWEVAGLAVTPAEAVGVLLGAPLTAAPATIEAASALGSGGLRVAQRRADTLAREELDFDAEARLRRWMLAGADGEPLLEAHFADYRPLGDTAFAYEVELADHASGARARIDWHRVELNPALPATLFALPGAEPAP